MKVLVTGAKGFIGKNVVSALENIRDGKDRRPRYRGLLPLTVYSYDRDSTPEELEFFCQNVDFVLNFAGVNRPDDPAEFMQGNFGFASMLLEGLERAGNNCPVMLASSIQASLEGRYAGSAYGESKLAGERLFQDYSVRTGAEVLIYRFPNVYGKWCRPNYNSVVATFCHNVAHGLPVRIDDPEAELELLYVEDLVRTMRECLIGNVLRTKEGFCKAEPIDRATLGEIIELLYDFRDSRKSLVAPDLTRATLSKKLYSTYLSYLEHDDLAYDLHPNIDERGSFTEFLRTPDRGQFSINVSKPGVTKGQHWHCIKWERFLVVSGEALIRERRVGVDDEGNRYPTVEYRVSGDFPRVVETPPGFTHSITNLSETKDLVCVIWANEVFDPESPDTYREEV